MRFVCFALPRGCCRSACAVFGAGAGAVFGVGSARFLGAGPSLLYIDTPGHEVLGDRAYQYTMTMTAPVVAQGPAIAHVYPVRMRVA